MNTAFDTRMVTRDIQRSGMATCNVERSLGWGSSALQKALKRGSMRDTSLDQLACYFGRHISEYALDTLSAGRASMQPLAQSETPGAGRNSDQHRQGFETAA